MADVAAVRHRGAIGKLGKATGGMAKGTMKGAGKIGNVAVGGVRRTTRLATAMPGSAVKGVGNAAKFGVNTTKFVAKGTVKGTAQAAKVRRFSWICILLLRITEQKKRYF